MCIHVDGRIIDNETTGPSENFCMRIYKKVVEFTGGGLSFLSNNEIWGAL